MILDDQPGVLESAVVSVPHADMGEAALAVLVRDGDGPDMDAIRFMMRNDVARFKHRARLHHCGCSAAQHDGQGSEKRDA